MAESASITVGAKVVIRHMPNLGRPHYPGRTGVVIEENICGRASGGYWYVRLDATRRAKERVELFCTRELELLARDGEDEQGMELRIVEYELAYRHRVQVGIPSTSDEEAIAKAEAAFDNATLWDDPEGMPLLYDDYEEVDGPLDFKVVATVEAWPAPDHSVLKLRRDAAAEKACRLLMSAETLRKSGGADAEYQRMLDQVYRLASQAVLGGPEVQGAPRPRVVVGAEGGLVQGASSDLPVDLVVVDYDVRNPDDGALAIPQSGGGESLASLAQHAVDLDPGFVEGIWRFT